MQNIQPFTVNSFFANGGSTPNYPQTVRQAFFSATQPYVLVGLQLSTSFADDYAFPADPCDPYGVAVVVNRTSQNLAFSQAMNAAITHLALSGVGSLGLSDWIGFGETGIVIPTNSQIGLYGFAPTNPGGNVFVCSAVCSLYLIPIETG